jgi:dihydroorotate dehydrogenase
MSAYRWAAPLLRLIDPEQAHGLAIAALRAGLVPGERPSEAPGAERDDPILSVSLWGRDFTNPIGIAAGFDKDARAVAPLFRLGFGFVEVGSITPRPQPGNPRPRLFRLSEDQAVINRMGFNSRGMEAAAGELARARGAAPLPGPLGVNLGKNKDSASAAEDYRRGAERLAGFADYLVINVSSPNTPGLRALQAGDELARLIAAVREVLPEEAPPALLVKLAPDLAPAELEAIAETALAWRVDGLIATNTTLARPPGLKSAAQGEAGGLSGRPLFEPSTRVLAQLHRLVGGRIPLVGVGGVASGADAYAKIRAGAVAVQLYTALTYAGPALVRQIKRDLAACLRRDGCAAVADAVGAAHR